MPLRTRLVALLAALALGVILFPFVASAFWLNLANASIAHAMALPIDAPARHLDLLAADTQLAQSNGFAELPRALLGAGRAALAQGDAASALGVLSRLKTSDAVIEFTRGNAAWETHQSEEAFDHWARSGALTFFLQEALRAARAHDWERARDLSAKAMGIDPANAQAHYVWADASSREPTLSPRVFDELDQALTLAEDKEFRATILSRQAELRVRQSRFDLALSLFEEAQKQAPTDPRPRTGYALALLHSNAQAREQAITLLEQVTSDSPWYTDAYGALATLAEARGDLPSAEKWLRLGLERNRNNSQLLAQLGEFYARHGRIEEAHSAFLQALKYETRADELLAINRRLADLALP